MPDITGIIEFLRTRLNEDEHRACAVHNFACDSWPEFKPDRCNCGEPQRLQAEVEAKRRIIERAEFLDHHGPALDHDRAMDMTIGAAGAFRDVLWLLALPYSDHPEYDAA